MKQNLNSCYETSNITDLSRAQHKSSWVQLSCHGSCSIAWKNLGTSFHLSAWHQHGIWTKCLSADLNMRFKIFVVMRWDTHRGLCEDKTLHCTKDVVCGLVCRSKTYIASSVKELLSKKHVRKDIGVYWYWSLHMTQLYL